MFFDALTMACVADELRQTILGGRVQQVVQADRLTVGLEIYARGQRHYLLTSAHADLGRLHLASAKLRRGIEKETGLLLLLRKYARGAMLAAIEQPPFERILRLEFDHHEWGCCDLMVEIMGRHSNVILVDATGQVMDAVKRVGPEMSSVRPIVPNGPYTLPPPQEKLPPSELTEYRLRQILAGQAPDAQVWQALVGGLKGVSPLLAREICFRVLGKARARISQVEHISPLLEAAGELFSPLEHGTWQPTVVVEEGRPVVYAPYPVTHRGEPQAVTSMSQAIEEWVAAVATIDPYAGAKRPLQEAIARARSRLTHNYQSLERSMKEAAEAEQWRQWGEWILAYAHEITPRQEELAADTGEGVLVIPLDPDLPAADNAQVYFTRYRKAQRAAQEVPPRLRKVELALRDLEQLETDLDLADSRPVIEEVRAALAEAGHLRARKRRRAGRMASSEPLALVSPDGLPILVGRNSRQNDEVTFRRAGSDEWWFHARGVPGAHVIVRSGESQLPAETIRRAAELAAYFSQLRAEADVLVDYTRRRYVRRIAGAAPGLVTYSREQTTRVPPRGPEPDEAGD